MFTPGKDFSPEVSIVHHSIYKGCEILKVTQANGRVTYDYVKPGEIVPDSGYESLAVCRANIRVDMEG